MSNGYFAFKQFTVHQDGCAMKVSTDGCIQGAWTPVDPSVKRILDVGAGTGLLSMMIAQRLPGAHIDAVELDEPAAFQAARNASSSPFASRIKITRADAIGWAAPHRYDLIICNPPFFKNSLTGPDAARNAARHAGTLNPQSLVDLLLQHLSADGVASVMWPLPEHESFSVLAAVFGICLQSALQVRDKAGGRITRVVGIYGRQPCMPPVTHELIIKSPDGSYTPAFADLLKPFYLHL